MICQSVWFGVSSSRRVICEMICMIVISEKKLFCRFECKYFKEKNQNWDHFINYWKHERDYVSSYSLNRKIQSLFEEWSWLQIKILKTCPSDSSFYICFFFFPNSKYNESDSHAKKLWPTNLLKCKSEFQIVP